MFRLTCKQSKLLRSQSQKSDQTESVSSPASEAVVLSEAEHNPIEVTNEDKESAVLDF